MDLSRRSLLSGGAAVAASATSVRVADAENQTPTRASCADTAVPPELKSAAIYVPGYNPDRAYANGEMAVRHSELGRNVKSRNSPYRLLSRIGMDGSIRQAVLPVAAHDVEIAPDRSVGILCGMNYGGHVTFDPETLDISGVGKPFRKGWNGGGHAVFLADSKTVLISERAPRKSLRYKVESHYGRITIRDPESMKILESYSTHGIDPHDIRLVENGRFLVIANYGSVIDKRTGDYTSPRRVVEASVTIVEVASGKLIDKQVSNTEHTELRHLAAKNRDTVFAIQALLDKDETGAATHAGHDTAYSVGLTHHPASNYMVANTLRFSGPDSGGKPMGSANARALMQQGISIKYDREHDTVIASYPSTHRVMVFDAASGETIRIIDTSAMGLRYPCGVTFLPDGKHYAVTGYWENLFVFERDSHQLVRDLCLYPVFFGHSHICAA